MENKYRYGGWIKIKKRNRWWHHFVSTWIKLKQTKWSRSWRWIQIYLVCLWIDVLIFTWRGWTPRQTFNTEVRVCILRFHSKKTTTQNLKHLNSTKNEKIPRSRISQKILQVHIYLYLLFNNDLSLDTKYVIPSVDV